MPANAYAGAISSYDVETGLMNANPSSEAPSVEACIEALDETMMQLAHHSGRTLAAALAVHLQGVIAVLHERRECSAEEVHQWLEEIVRGVWGDER